MARKRIHELAKELNLTSKELIAKADAMGMAGKRSQSSLTEEEEDRLKADAGWQDKPSVTVGDERLVTGVTGQTLVERRVATNVIRRRRSQADGAEGGTGQPVEPMPLPPSETFQSFAAPDSLSVPIPSPPPEVQDTAPTAVSETPASVASPEPPPSMEPERVPAAAPPVERRAVPPGKVPAELPPLSPGMHRAKVLGRIDLTKPKPPEPTAAERAARAGRERPRPAETPAPTAGEAAPPPTEDGRRKKKKRRVIRKSEAPEMREQDRLRSRPPRKKKALPGKEQKKTEITTPRASKRVVRISEVITVGELARAMGVKAAEIIKKLMDSGMMATINQLLDIDTATLLASDFEYNVENVAFDAESALEEGHEAAQEEGNLVPRPPVVTIMGHVDHGKTSLLDAVRQTNVTEQEAGGITQHIGAYTVDVGRKIVTFLDTPGHEAFTAMRARGAKVTDLVVLVVAADDGVMPQTVEAINHARAAGVPIIVAINKIDKPEANLERIRQGLADYGLVSEEWGGDTICAPVSAKTKEGIDHLLEMILLQSEVLDLKANPDKLARGTIVEAKLDRGRGPVATVLVQEGTLKRGDPFVCGGNYGRVRAMIDDKGDKVESAGPSVPVEILGLQGVPEAGNSFVAVQDEATARQVAEHRRSKQREQDLSKTAKVSLEDLYQQIQTGSMKELGVVVKADVQGSVEALRDALTRLSTPEVKVNVLHGSVGGITESDVLLASASNAVIIGFNVRPETKAGEIAEREGVDIRLYNIIYDAQNAVREAMEGLLEPTVQEKALGRAEVRQTFTIPGGGIVAGSYVVDGKIVRNAQARLVRDHVVVYTGKISSLRRFKEDAREVSSGYECGITLEDYQDIKQGDVVEAFEMETVVRKLSAPTARAVGAESRV
jgi:translation initiation factor IF-2